MIYYFTIFLFFLLSILNLIKIDKNIILAFSILSFIYIVILGGLRYKVGADWESYERLFNSINYWQDIFEQREEPLFVILTFISKNIVNSYSFFIFVCFIISFSFKYNFIRRYSNNIFFSLIIYLFTVFLIYDVNGIRQGIALGLGLFSIKYIIRRDSVKFYIILLIACTFHISAIFFIPFYYLSRISISNTQTILILIIFLAISTLIRSIIKESTVFQNLLAVESLEHYSVYTTDDEYNLDIPILSAAVFQRIFIYFSFIAFYKKIKLEENTKLLLRNGYLIGILIFLLLSFSSEFAARLSFYYKSLEIIMIPLIIGAPLKFYRRLVLLIIFTIFASIGIYRLLDIPDGHLVPYRNIILNLSSLKTNAY